MFLEMKGVHWYSRYLHLWPECLRPAAQVRTMTGNLEVSSTLPDDIPHPKSHTVKFYAKLFFAWAAMGFRNPTLKIERKIDACRQD